jgi:hypothetical protein
VKQQLLHLRNHSECSPGASGDTLHSWQSLSCTWRAQCRSSHHEQRPRTTPSKNKQTHASPSAGSSSNTSNIVLL